MDLRTYKRLSTRDTPFGVRDVLLAEVLYFFGHSNLKIPIYASFQLEQV
jgi:hypothetical protein